jgi:hypothetical protein
MTAAAATANPCFPHNLCCPPIERSRSPWRMIFPHQLATLLDKAPETGSIEG